MWKRYKKITIKTRYSISYFHCCGQKPINEYLKEEGFTLGHSLMVQSLMAGRTWGQELAMADHREGAERTAALSLLIDI